MQRITLTTIKPTIVNGKWGYRPFTLTRDERGYSDRPALIPTNQDEIDRFARQMEEIAK